MKKRIFALVLALVMALGLTVTAAADEATPSLTIGDRMTEEVSVQFNNNGSEDVSHVKVTGYVLNGGSYKLTDDLTITAPLIIQGTVTLDLNGHTLTYNGTAQNSVIVVDDGANFTLTDTGTGGKITGGTGTKYENIDAETPMNSSIEVYGGGVFVGSTATFTMTGGSIENCSATGDTLGTLGTLYGKGGGVYVARGNSSKTTFTMNGGSIVGCSSSHDGGGVCTAADTSTSIKNSTITGCEAAKGGGGVYCVSQFNALSITSSTISGCKAYQGGGVYYSDHASVNDSMIMENSKITNCTAGERGGGIYLYKGKTFMGAKSTISDCRANYGGGVVMNNGIFTMEADSTISDCTASVYGNAVCTGLQSEGAGGTMDTQGGSVYGRVFNNASGWIKNDSSDGSTIFYADNGTAIDNTNGGTIQGKLVKFMNGDTLYAETVAKDGGKISAPKAPTAPEGKTFAGWYTAETGGNKWNFNTDTVSADMTLYARWGCAHTGGDWQHDGSSHWKICAACGEKYDEAAHDGRTCTVCGYQKPSGTTTKPTTPTETVTSPNTTDPGVLLTAALSVASLLGMGYVGKKR